MGNISVGSIDGWAPAVNNRINGFLAYNSGVPAYVGGNNVDGTASIAVILDNYSALSASGAKLLSVRNSGTEKAYIDYNGYVVSSGSPVGRMVAVPASATGSGSPGDFAADTSYFYVCIAINTWQRVATSTW